MPTSNTNLAKRRRSNFYTWVNTHSEITLGQLLNHYSIDNNPARLVDWLSHDDVWGPDGVQLCLRQLDVHGEPDELNGVWDGVITIKDNHWIYAGADGPSVGTKAVTVRIEAYSVFDVC